MGFGALRGEDSTSMSWDSFSKKVFIQTDNTSAVFLTNLQGQTR